MKAWNRLRSLRTVRHATKARARQTLRTLETLENRCLLTSGSLSGTTWILTGTHVAETITLTENDTHYSFTDSLNATGLTSVAKTAVSSIVVNAANGSDTVDASSITSIGITINGAEGNDMLIGGAGNDTINGGTGNNTLYGHGGNDTLMGGTGTNLVEGGDGNDILIASNFGTAIETLRGGPGNDTIQAQGTILLNDVVLDGGDGEDTLVNIVPVGNTRLGLSVFSPDNSIETIQGNGGEIWGTGNADTLDFSRTAVADTPRVYTNTANDVVTTSASHTGPVTEYDGWQNTDTINLVFTPAQLDALTVAELGVLQAYANAPTGKVLGPVGTVGVTNIVPIQFSARNFEAATVQVKIGDELFDITGCLGKNLIVGSGTINGTSGDDLILGSASNDTINGGAGNDCIFAGAGDDLIRVHESQGIGDVVVGGDGTDTVERASGGDLRFVSVLNLTDALPGGYATPVARFGGVEVLDLNNARIIDENGSRANHYDLTVFPSIVDLTQIDTYGGNDLVKLGGSLSFVGSATHVITQGGADIIDASAVANVSVNGAFVGGLRIDGGADADTITGTPGAALELALAANPLVPISIPTTATGFNLTSMGGRMTADNGVVYTIWRLRNGTASPESATLTASGVGVVFTGTLPANSDTFFASPAIAGAATHVLSVPAQGFSSTKAAGAGTFDYDQVVGGNDTITGGAGGDTMYGLGGDDVFLVAAFEGVGDIVDGGAGADAYRWTGGGDLRMEHVLNLTDALPAPFTGTVSRFGNVETLDLATAGGGRVIDENGSRANHYDLTVFPSIVGLTQIDTYGGNDLVKLGGSLSFVGSLPNVITQGGADVVDASAVTSGGLSINGGDGDDTLTGTAFADVITGGAGGDTMNGLGGNDLFHLGENDAIGDTVDGGAGSDTYRRSFGGDLRVASLLPIGGALGGFTGPATQVANLETLDLNGGRLIEANFGSGVANLYDFTVLSNVINAGTGTNNVDSSGGADTAFAPMFAGSQVRYDGGAGSDTVNLVFTPAQLGAMSPADIATLNSYVANPTGKVLAPSGGTNNIASLNLTARNYETAKVIVALDGQLIDITGCLVGINNVVVMTSTSYTDAPGNNSLIIGNNNGNTIDAGDGHDIVFGLAGNDTITGGAGDDCLFGGTNDDVFRIEGTDALGDIFNGGGNTDTVRNVGSGAVVLTSFQVGTNVFAVERFDFQNKAIDGTAGPDTLAFTGLDFHNGPFVINGLGDADTISVAGVNENVTINGGDGADILTGGDNGDVLNGGDGDDTLSGNAGNDVINGGVGADIMNGGANDDLFLIAGDEALADTFNGDGNTDTVRNVGSGAVVLTAFQVGTNVFTVERFDFQGKAIDGTANADTLVFTNLDFWNGPFVINGLGDADTISVAGVNENVTINGGDGADILTGGNNGDVLNGDDGDDTLHGGNGHDQLIGGLGADTMTGGANDDTYVFAPDDTWDDVITDFLTGGGFDRINLAAYGTTFANVVQTPVSGPTLEITVPSVGTKKIKLNGVTSALASNRFIFS
jgi:Ca2+-binding RTX toxin-like protein